MKVTYKGEKFNVELEGNQKSLFKDLSMFQEVFENTACGSCGGGNIRYVVRQVDGNDFYELHCKTCRAKLAFGQHKGGVETLFPKRKDAEGNWLPDMGWTKYIPEQKNNE